MANEYFRATGSVDGNLVVGSDQDAFAEFYLHPELDVPFCRKVFPGDKTNVWDQPVRQIDKEQYPQLWENFNKGFERFHGQTRLEQWPVCNEGLRRHLNGNQIYTVEQVAGIADGNLEGLGPNSLKIREKALLFMEEKEKAKQFEPMKDELAALRAQLAEVQAAQAEAKPRGRPAGSKNKPKEEAA